MAWCDCENCAKLFACTKLVGIRFGGCSTDNEPLPRKTSGGDCRHNCMWCKYGAECKWPGKYSRGYEERSGDNA